MTEGGDEGSAIWVGRSQDGFDLSVAGIDLAAIQQMIRQQYDLPDVDPPPDVAEFLAASPLRADPLSTEASDLDVIGEGTEGDIDRIQYLRAELIADLAATDRQAAASGPIGASREARRAQAAASTAEDWMDAIADAVPQIRARTIANADAVRKMWKRHALIPAGLEGYLTHLQESAAELSARLSKLDAQAHQLRTQGLSSSSTELLAVDTHRAAIVPVLLRARILLQNLDMVGGLASLENVFADLSSVLWGVASDYAHALREARQQQRLRRARHLVFRELAYVLLSAVVSVKVADVVSHAYFAGFGTFLTAELLLNVLDRWCIAPSLQLHDNVRSMDGLIAGVDECANLLTSVRRIQGMMEAPAALNEVELTPVLGTLIDRLAAIQRAESMSAYT
ncbi:MAG: hypothetical protein ABIP57_17460 [Jatrophihabitantaceae bacterium]